MGDLSLHFSTYEFKCPCCNKLILNYNLLYILEAIREHFKKPVIISSGYRCSSYNSTLQNSASNSSHINGEAADIIVQGIKAKDVYEYINKINPKGGLGKYNTFNHVDVSMTIPGRRWFG